LRSVGLLCAVLGLVFAAAPPAVAHAAKSTAKGRGLQFTYEVRARDSRIGQAKLTVGPKQALGKRQVRALLIEGSTEDLVGVLYAGKARATTWVDSAWVPVEAHWRSEFGRKKGEAEAVYTPKRVKAMFARPGKPNYKVDQATSAVPHDMVSVIPWLMQQKPKPGFRATIPVYTGMDVCELDALARPPESILVPMGRRQAVPVDLVFTRCRVSRRFTVWLDEKDWTPHRMLLPDPVLGAIEVVLLAWQPLEVAPVLPEGPRKDP